MERTESFEAPKKRRNNKDKNQRRFSDVQIKLLETKFESESRLEPKKKVELATELGLSPRQVAIWFQNRRARWKSKRVEQDFRALRAEYDILVSKFESLKEEKQSLVSQLQKLNEMLRKDGGSTGNVNNPESDLAKLSLQEGLEERGVSEDVEGLSRREIEAEASQQVEASLASLESWYRYDLAGALDQSRAGSQWMNLWC